MNQKKLQILAASVVVATLIAAYPLCMHLNQLGQRLETAKVAVDKLSEEIKALDKQMAELEEAQTAEPLPPAAAHGTQEFVSTATGAGGVKVTVRSASGRVSILPDCEKPRLATKSEPQHENPDGDGASYQEDVVGNVYQLDTYSYVMDVPSDYPTP